MAGSPYGTMLNILRADHAILDAAFTAHTVRHGCGDSCETRRVLRKAQVRIGEMLASEAAQGGRGRDYESIALAYTDEG